MRNPGGTAEWAHANGRKVTRDTYTCGHCNNVKFVEPKQDPTTLGGLCKMCMKHICPDCCKAPKCDPFEKKLERIEARARFHDALGTSRR